ncbi:hypothetical protein BU23DRAFT_601136 [Bimuria novae-zelandiae CBS 107.79]|uniref:P-loop containing nucleoside triphosphate hydrolase protein n=1 Tax=Bimuria novae-zelandiae CBS 107.79 TaxID=1447943 RepID=A0A6A5V5A6_9PLEO|nr:hypothetical protein BU23DRAFT_601136 [Bimuria novae-zelandiae CBS 107.79]
MQGQGYLRRTGRLQNRQRTLELFSKFFNYYPQNIWPLDSTRRPENAFTATSPGPDDAPSSQCFNPDEVFDRDPSPEVDPEESAQLVDQHIREVIAQHDAKILEAGVARSIKTLDKLRSTFTHFYAASPDAGAWIQSIDKLNEQSRLSRTVLGVVGNTGAGKSSVINALLDEEHLVPTNCMRACTAVVTEISWSFSDDPAKKYRAEIEFIDRVEWAKELKILRQEFLNENGSVAREASDANTDAGIAWAKFHTVYPSIRKDELERWTVKKLMAESAVSNVLGTTKHINQARSGPFYTELQEFDALSTGAVVVDLPGVHDSNAARAAVAERYLKQCSGLWIVAPITRAVDDKSAKNLLGDTFRRQLKYDGNYPAVTFICSRCDDISIEEALTSLDLTEEAAELYAKKREYEQKIQDTEAQIEDLMQSASVYKVVLEEADDELDEWEPLKERVETEEVFAPSTKANNKRKKGNRKVEARKRRREDDSDTEDGDSDSDDPSDSEDDSDTDGVEPPREALTLADVTSKLADPKTTRKNAWQELKAAEEQIEKLKPSIRETKREITEVDAQQDFAAGIKELDQEAAIEADEETFNPDEEIRNYNEVADVLPVFCPIIWKRLEELEKGLQQAVAVCLDSIKLHLQENVLNRMKELVQDAVQSAPDIAESWGRPKDQGGLHWTTYKAVVRRGGTYQSATSGLRDFNAELMDPITKKIATSWECTFQQRLPRSFETYTKNAANIVQAFHTRVEERAQQNGVGLANLAILKGSIATYQQMFDDLNTALKQRMTKSQHDANREFVPTVAHIMSAIYEDWKDVFIVREESPRMFPAATFTVEDALKRMCRDLEEEMDNKAEEIYRLMRQDYMQVLGGAQVVQDAMTTRERSLRSAITARLKEIDRQFERLAIGDVADDDDELMEEAKEEVRANGASSSSRTGRVRRGDAHETMGGAADGKDSTIITDFRRYLSNTPQSERRTSNDEDQDGDDEEDEES